MNKVYLNRYRLAILCLIVSTVTLQWGRLGSSIRFGDLGMIVFIFLAGFYWIFARVKIDGEARKILFAYVFIWIVAVIAFFFHKTPEGYYLIQQCILYTCVCFLVSSIGVRISDFPYMARAGTIATLLFLIVSGSDIGIPFITEYVNWLLNYEYRSMLSAFYRPLFNAFSGEDGLLISGSKRNAYSMALLLLLALFICSIKIPRNMSLFILDSTMMIFLLSLVLSMFSRSALLVVILSIGVLFLVRKERSQSVVLRVLLLFMATVFLLYVLIGMTGFGEVLFERLFYDTYSYEYRLGHIEEFFSATRNSLIGGVGFYITNSGNTIHNLFLGSWSQAGVVGLLSSLLLFGLVFLKFYKFLLIQNRAKILAILFLPFFIRTLVGGNAGFPELANLLGVFIACSALSLSNSNSRANVETRSRRKRRQ